MNRFFISINLFIVLLSCLLIAPVNLLAQKVYKSQENKLPTKFSDYEILGKNNAGTVVYYFGSNNYQLSLLNNKLETVKNKEIYIQGNNVVDVLLLKNKIAVFYLQSDYQYQYLKVKTYSNSLEELNTIVIDSISQQVDNNKKFYVKVSPNSERIVSFTIIEKDNTTLIRFSVWSEQLQLQAKNVISSVGEMVSVRSVKINNSGVVATVFGHRDKWTNDDYEFSKYEVKIYNPATKVIYESEIQRSNIAFKKLITDINLDRELLYIVSSYKNTSNKDDIGFYYKAIDFRTNNTVIERYFAISEQDVTDSKTFDFKSWRDKVFTLSPKRIIPRSDGGFLFVVESEFSYTTQDRVTNATNNGYYSPVFGWQQQPVTVRTNQFNTFADVFIYSINKDGSLDWRSNIQKSQQSENDDAYFSSFALFEANNVLKFLYNEDINASGNFVEYNINPLGNYKRYSLLNTIKENLYLIPNKAKQLDGNTIVIPAENKRDIQFVKFEY